MNASTPWSGTQARLVVCAWKALMRIGCRAGAGGRQAQEALAVLVALRHEIKGKLAKLDRLLSIHVPDPSISVLHGLLALVEPCTDLHYWCYSLLLALAASNNGRYRERDVRHGLRLLAS